MIIRNCIVGCPCGHSPIVIDTKGEGFHLTNVENGVIFRETALASSRQFSWTDPAYHNGWLALPKNGRVQSLQDLFGDLTPQPQSDRPNGYLALAYLMQQNGCGSPSEISEQNCSKIWQDLRVWIDSNGDGVSQSGELHTLDEVGVKSISLAYHQSRRVDEFGNLFRYVSKISDTEGAKDNRCYDVFLVEGMVKK